MTDDLLTELLRDAGLQRRVLDARALAPATALAFPCNRSMGLHAVLRGPVFVHAPGLGAPLALDSGDIAVMARGTDHVLATVPVLDGVPVRPIGVSGAGGHAESAGSGAAGDDDGAAARVISGAYQFWHAPVHPFFAELPAWSVLRAAALPRLGPIALVSGLIEAELRQRGAGRQFVLHGLLDVVFALALRELSAQCAVAHPGWSQAARDPAVARALAAMHEELARAWTLDELAVHAGLSRTALANRFRDAMGDTPLNHLRTLRMQRAMRLLADTEQRLEAVAAAVGYQDAFGFSKVFKRCVGLSPSDFRHRDSADRALAYRFAAA